MIAILAAMLICPLLGATEDQTSTMVTVIMGCIGLMMLYKVSRPLNRIRLALLVLMAVGFFGAALIMPSFFNLVHLPFRLIALTAGFVVVSAPVMVGLSYLLDRLCRRRKREKRKRRGSAYDY